MSTDRSCPPVGSTIEKGWRRLCALLQQSYVIIHIAPEHLERNPAQPQGQALRVLRSLEAGETTPVF